jgi:hypothetical protein
MYDFLCRYLPDWVAEILLVIWYLLLIIAILKCLQVPPGEFRYGNL